MPLSCTRNVPAVTVVRSRTAFVLIASATLVGTLTAASGGLVFKIAGEVAAGAELVRNCVVLVGTVLPATSFTPAIVNVITVAAGSGAWGVTPTIWFAPLNVIAPGIVVTPPPLNWTVVELTVSGSTV